MSYIKGDAHTFSPLLEEFIARVKISNLTFERINEITGIRKETLYHWFHRKKNPNDRILKQVLNKINEVQI